MLDNIVPIKNETKQETENEKRNFIGAILHFFIGGILLNLSDKFKNIGSILRKFINKN